MDKIVEIQMKNTVLRVQVPKERPICVPRVVGPRFVSANCILRSDTELPAGVPQDPMEAVLAGVVECSNNVVPPSNMMEVGSCLNDLAGLEVDGLDTYIFKHDGDDVVSVSDAGEEAASPQFCLYGDHGYSLCPSLEKTVDAVSESTSQPPKPIGDEMNCPICGDTFYDPVYLNLHALVKHQVETGIPEVSLPSTARGAHRNQYASNQENMDSTELPRTTSRSKLRRPKPEYHQEEDLKPEPYYHEDIKYESTSTYDCFIKKCNYKAAEESHLRTHIHTIHGEDRGKYKCLYCGEILRTASLFYEHYRKHEEAKLFHCGYCQRRFWQKWSMQAHRHRCY